MVAYMLTVHSTPRQRVAVRAHEKCVPCCIICSQIKKIWVLVAKPYVQIACHQNPLPPP